MTKTAQELGISEEKRAAIEMVGRLLESGELVHREIWSLVERLPPGRWFCMNYWTVGGGPECGTAACIGGWAETLGKLRFDVHGDLTEGSVGLDRLFYPDVATRDYRDITAEEAARAIRNYLDHGEPRWEEVL